MSLTQLNFGSRSEIVKIKMLLWVLQCTLQSLFTKMIVRQNDRLQLFLGKIFELSKMIVRQNDSFPPAGRKFFELSKMICSAK